VERGRATSSVGSGTPRPMPRRAGWPPRRPRPAALAPSATPSPPSAGDRTPKPMSRRARREAAENETSQFHVAPDVAQEKNPFLERVTTGEVFRQSLALIRAQRERYADPLDEFLRRNAGDSSYGARKKPKKS
jgi:hypothetical protein